MFVSLSKFHISEDSSLFFFTNSTIDLLHFTIKIMTPDEPNIMTSDHPNTFTINHNLTTSPTDIVYLNKLPIMKNPTEYATYMLILSVNPLFHPLYGSPLEFANLIVPYISSNKLLVRGLQNWTLLLRILVLIPVPLILVSSSEKRTVVSHFFFCTRMI